MKLSNKQYDFLKWLVWLFLPAFTTLVGVIGQTVRYPNIDVVITIMTAFTTFLGAITGLSNRDYNR